MPSASWEESLFNRDPSAYLPHRHPFLILDRIIELEPGSYAIAQTSVSASQNFPQVLLVECVAQLAGVVTIQEQGQGGFLAAIDQAEFRVAPCPGDLLIVTAKVVKAFGRLFLIEGGVDRSGESLLTTRLTLGMGTL